MKGSTSMNTSAPDKATKAFTAPRAGAAAGLLFAALFGLSVVLVRLSVPANSADASAWTESSLNRAILALRLIPFAGIFFLWFVGVIRAECAPDHRPRRPGSTFTSLRARPASSGSRERTASSSAARSCRTGT